MDACYQYNRLFSVAENTKIIKLSELHTLLLQLMDKNEKGEDEYGNYDFAESTDKRIEELSSLLQNPEISFEGNSNDYHNLAVDCAKKEHYGFACIIIERGLQNTPYSVDLLADMIRYQLDKGSEDRMKKCEVPYQKLKELNPNLWNWRAFSFSLDYLLEKWKAQKGASMIKSEIVRCADRFVKKMGDDPKYADQAYFDRAMVEKECGNKITAVEIEILKKPIDNGYRAPKCALSLADIYFESQQYEDAIKMLQICAKNVFSPQPDISGGYTFLLTALTKATLLFDDHEKDKKDYDVNRINEIYKDFRTALKEFSKESVYAKTAHSAINVIEIQSGVKYDKPDEYAF